MSKFVGILAEKLQQNPMLISSTIPPGPLQRAVKCTTLCNCSKLLSLWWIVSAFHCSCAKLLNYLHGQVAVCIWLILQATELPSCAPLWLLPPPKALVTQLEPSPPHRPDFCPVGPLLWCSGPRLAASQGQVARHGDDQRCSYWYNAAIVDWNRKHIENTQTRRHWKNLKVLPIEQLETERNKSSKFLLDFHKSDICFRFSDTHCDTLISQKLNFIHLVGYLTMLFEVSMDAFWFKRALPKLAFVSLQLTRSKVSSTAHECPMPPERCLELTFIISLFLLQKRWMSSMASQNPGCEHAPWKTVRTSRVDSSNDPCSNFSSPIPSGEKIWLKDIMFNDGIPCKIYSPWSLSEKKLAGFGSLRVGTHQEHRSTSPRALCTCCRFIFFSPVILHKQMSLSTQPLWKNFPQGHCAWRPSSLSILSWSSSMSSLTSVMTSLTSMAEARACQLNESMQQL